ncbi:hypothetical protein ACQEWB_22560 [Streptomyces sp. CA-249302]|uniref:hypothetical protein n=1 Tax=Streptomyces sp. CA-249302 TaxID=3240058 RepID=UPI003D8DC06B
MDSTVIAAVIATPTAILAAATAYAAGRAQARGAHRGPVDAIRRQHQRETYAAFLATAHTFADETNYLVRMPEVVRQQAASGRPEPDDPLWLPRTTLGLMAASDMTPLRNRGAVVSLEGPAFIAAAATQVQSAALHTLNIASAICGTLTEWAPSGNELTQLHRELRQAIEAFTLAARDHLNASE